MGFAGLPGVANEGEWGDVGWVPVDGDVVGALAFFGGHLQDFFDYGFYSCEELGDVYTHEDFGEACEFLLGGVPHSLYAGRIAAAHVFEGYGCLD